MSNQIKVILIEDDKKKIEDIKAFFDSSFQDFDIITKESYHSGMKALLETKYDLLLLDMSIPTWDKTPIEMSGSFEKFGGYKILRELKRRKKVIRTILISMFDDFGESDNALTLAQLTTVLKTEFNQFFLGSVYYNSREAQWKENLCEYLNAIRNEDFNC